ncbi:deaminase domain-containing protein [Paenibacillus motobuensis]|uniref:Deaminase n=1 Tax=Paenibacillus motobuensis TaxID=295324 RepID=A0ABN0YPM5_9BACL
MAATENGMKIQIPNTYRIETPENPNIQRKHNEFQDKKEFVETKGTGRRTTRVLDESVDATLISRVKNIRNSLPSDLSRSGNVGLAEVDIPGLKKEFYAHSGIDVLSDARSSTSIVSDISLKPTNPTFKASTDITIDGRDLLRDIDTEYKILNDVASQLGSKFDIKGNLTLFTEKPPCASCSKVIDEFMTRYKNITIEVVHNNHQRILP